MVRTRSSWDTRQLERRHFDSYRHHNLHRSDTRWHQPVAIDRQSIEKSVHPNPLHRPFDCLKAFEIIQSITDTGTWKKTNVNRGWGGSIDLLPLVPLMISVQICNKLLLMAPVEVGCVWRMTCCKTCVGSKAAFDWRPNRSPENSFHWANTQLHLSTCPVEVNKFWRCTDDRWNSRVEPNESERCRFRCFSPLHSDSDECKPARLQGSTDFFRLRNEFQQRAWKLPSLLPRTPQRNVPPSELTMRLSAWTLIYPQPHGTSLRQW